MTPPPSVNSELTADAGALRSPLEHPQFSRWLVAAITVAAVVVLGMGAYTAVTGDMPQLAAAIVGGCLAAAATAAGTLPVLLSWQPSQRMHDALLGFGAGVMLAACAFSLIIPALDAVSSAGGGKWEASGTVGFGIIAGAFALLWIDRLLPHEHFIKGLEGSRARQLKRVWLFVIAIALHNVPEGLAIGVAFAAPDALRASALAIGISIQDIPEGLVVALAMRAVGYGRAVSVGVAVFTGLIEPLMAMFGVLVVTLSAAMLPWGLAAAAGAMLFVISHEIIPESHRQGHESWATGGLMVGFVLMMLLDTALG
ncbi:MAG TPA: ZIP family metal transporter [Burkholderiaceae bacterium]|jgi:ZIP family zinc transporter|nr:ZIP family metal transporter [Burkholderiaceae bacterium]